MGGLESWITTGGVHSERKAPCVKTQKGWKIERKTNPTVSNIVGSPEEIRGQSQLWSHKSHNISSKYSAAVQLEIYIRSLQHLHPAAAPDLRTYKKLRRSCTRMSPSPVAVLPVPDPTISSQPLLPVFAPSLSSSAPSFYSQSALPVSVSQSVFTGCTTSAALTLSSPSCSEASCPYLVHG